MQNSFCEKVSWTEQHYDEWKNQTPYGLPEISEFLRDDCLYRTSLDKTTETTSPTERISTNLSKSWGSNDPFNKNATKLSLPLKSSRFELQKKKNYDDKLEESVLSPLHQTNNDVIKQSAENRLTNNKFTQPNMQHALSTPFLEMHDGRQCTFRELLNDEMPATVKFGPDSGTPKYDFQQTGCKQTKYHKIVPCSVVPVLNKSENNYLDSCKHDQFVESDKTAWSNGSLAGCSRKEPFQLVVPFGKHYSENWQSFHIKKTDNACEGIKANNTVDQYQLDNLLLEDIDLSAVDSYRMEQLEKEYRNEAVKDVEFACSLLNLTKDPCEWNENQVQKWVMWTVHQLRLPSVDISLYRMSGKKICSMTEIEMRLLEPRFGDILHARMDVWRSVAKISQTSATCHQTGKTNEVKSSSCQTPKAVSSSTPNFEKRIESMTPNHTNGIHLWQFLKELLLQPNMYAQCIRWMDQKQGIFKIEDSVEVARLWGVRKNRPAMNYDKLSRSIRQYYKKGIIRKTQISQRLVYQFVKPK